ncbi:hypothetical protein A3F34_00685 [Candidatus Roizmanbacteria bacterium RIFCSPHIGHO2_12_FULL_44_10]|uniref:Bacterial bifunctional deaminase-reductase C-terminal domain-containing protein n=1 Tax=Candidatus Roizmanbacteria bacterium RIFCSPHIGHO2_12_FULL_44_10 TaxID=1802054 RepID=A0A1F7I7V2_9BACT|nr:MAG: hypothetical protein A3F34_00685 [Candidatus Roizmanbacteria bacterium RIFCSPHIGHO2_12_FULL_44_10]
MKIIAVVVQSVNGRITNGNDDRVYKWTSEEDKKHLREMTAAASLIVMGSSTYDAFKQYLKLSPTTLRIVMTSHPEKYRDEVVAGQLEFSSQTPGELVETYGKKGHKKLLLLGGSKVYSSFMEAKLINELLLTVEPLLFGSGKPLVEGSETTSLKLISCKQLNEKGTLLLHYSTLLPTDV